MASRRNNTADGRLVVGSMDLTEVVTMLMEKGSKEQKLEWYKLLRHDLDEEVGLSLHGNVHDIETRGGAQSKAFMVSLLPKIWEHMLTQPRGTAFTVLDVGPGAAFGTELLASMHAGSFLGYTVAVSVLDIRDTYFELMDYRFRGIRAHIKQDLYALEQKYDLVVCSHVIEHVPAPARFVRRLQEVAKQKVFVLTPWKEDKERITKGHINTFDELFVDGFEHAEWELMGSIAWGAFLDPPYKMLYMGLPGLAHS